MASLNRPRRAAASVALALLGALAAAGCVRSSTERADSSSRGQRFGPSAGAAPHSFDTARVHLEPLGPEHAQSDFDALMGSRDHLRQTLGWGDWPRADFTLEENRADLERHHREFEQGEAFAYTVQSLDRARCVGCIYIHRQELEDASAGLRLDFWVVESELASDLDRHLLESVAHWLEREWGCDALLIAVRVDDPRGVRIARETGFKPCPARSSNEQTVLLRRAARRTARDSPSAGR